MRIRIKRYLRKKYGSVLVLVVMALIILAALGGGLMTVSYGVRHRAITIKNEAIAMLAAEAGYERAIFWMSQQQDMLYTMKSGGAYSDSIYFPNSSCNYNVSFYSFVNARPVYKITSTGRYDSGQPADSHKRHLPDPMIVEAAMTVGGGGWGAEHVGERKTTSSSYDKLVVRCTISEAMRGMVGTASLLSFPDSSNGYQKYYYLDERLLQGVLPGDIWMKSKYIPAPAGWNDYRVAQQ